MYSEFICLAAGVVISVVVSAFKGLAIVSKYPKAVAAVLAVLFSIVQGLTFGSFDWAVIAECIIGPFAVAVATYEVQKTVASSGGGV